MWKLFIRPLMSFRSCPIKARLGCGKCRKKGFLTDRKGARFPVCCDFDGSVSFLYNSVPLELSDREPELSPFFLTLFFTDESPEQAVNVLRRYQTGSSPKEAYTRGLLYRGVE